MILPLTLDVATIRDATGRVVVSALNPCTMAERRQIVRAVNAERVSDDNLPADPEARRQAENRKSRKAASGDQRSQDGRVELGSNTSTRVAAGPAPRSVGSGKKGKSAKADLSGTANGEASALPRKEGSAERTLQRPCLGAVSAERCAIRRG